MEIEFNPEERAQFDASAAEAERGYDAEFLRSRPVIGRPREIGAEAAVVVPLRVDPERLAAIDARARLLDSTRSQFIRDAIDRELARH
ncbi:MAG: ribbon-helix-helix protein, CopG family [Bifidobacteriaceae bacterium]|jgi:hypothetical protein|nr:ribbon-helix-helix protein, CopG family [Bifidobacteriaceae bacterium]